MARIAISLVVVLVAALGLVPGLPGPTPAVADHTSTSGMSGGFGGMTAGFGTGFGGMFGGGMQGHGGMGMGGTGMGGGTTAGAAIRGCGRGPDPQNVRASAIAELPRITIGVYDGYFLPAEISVQPGTVVVWRNFGTQPHTTTAWGRWNSDILRPGEACMAWFVTPGTYEYLSIVAADAGTMTGSITVEGPPIGSGTAGTTMNGQGGMGTMPLAPGLGGY